MDGRLAGLTSKGKPGNFHAGTTDIRAIRWECRKLKDNHTRRLEKKNTSGKEKPQSGGGRRALEAKSRALETIFNEKELLGRVMEDKELMRELLLRFLEDLPQYMDALRKALSHRDKPGAEHYAHTIKGAAANVAAPGIRALALEMEEAGREGELVSITRLFPQLEKEAALFRTTLKREKRR